MLNIRLLNFCLIIIFASVSGFALANLDNIKSTGVISFAIYKDFPPFSDQGEGIDIDIARAISKKLNLKLSIIPFPAGENIDDDLRNMVWKGHYLGIGPADVMLHVPIDRIVFQKNKQVKIFAPYFRETVKLVRNVKTFPDYNGISSLENKLLGAEKVSISAMVLLGNEKLRNNVEIFDSSTQALKKLKLGKLDAVVATRSSIESEMSNIKGFEISDAPFERLPKRGWVVGLAVKKENVDLAKLLQETINKLFDSGEMSKIFAKYNIRSVKP